MPPALRTENLSKHFGERRAVQGLNLEVQPGEIFGFLGPNGAGKTTTIAMLLHLLRPSSGRALLFGHDVWADPATALQRVGALIESPAFYPYLSGYHNLLALARMGGLPAPRVEAALELAGLSREAHAPFKYYSLGMRQRLAVAAALLREPQLLILDEPLNGLDPAGAYELRSLLQTLSQDGCTIFLSSHRLGEVQQTCQRVAVLKRGQIVAQGSVSELLQGESGLLIRVEGDPQPALELLRGLPGVAGIRLQDSRILVQTPLQQAAALNRHLVTSGVAVAELRPLELQLEELFLRLTGEAG